jgi:hypothetical protein
VGAGPFPSLYPQDIVLSIAQQALLMVLAAVARTPFSGSTHDFADPQRDTQNWALLRGLDEISCHWGHGLRVACYGDSNMPVADNLTTGRIKAFPTGARQIDLGPGMGRCILPAGPQNRPMRRAPLASAQSPIRPSSRRTSLAPAFVLEVFPMPVPETGGGERCARS